MCCFSLLITLLWKVLLFQLHLCFSSVRYGQCDFSKCNEKDEGNHLIDSIREAMGLNLTAFS